MAAAAYKRILIITDAWKPQVNGVVRTYEYLSAELEKAGHSVKVMGPGDFRLRFPMPGYREIDLTLFPARTLERHIRAFDPDIIHIGTEGPLGWAARRWCLREGFDFTTAYHTQFPAYVAERIGKLLPFMKRTTEKAADALLRRFHGPAAGVITTTPSLEAELRRRGYDMTFHAMARGVPLDLFTPGPSPLFETLPRPLALYAGRVAIEKNLEAFLNMDWPGSKIVVGSGPSLELLQSRYPEVIFTGKKIGMELVEHYRAADIFVFPSLTDTFGIVILEALACGLPVAAFNVTGPRDIVTEAFLGALGDNLAEAAQRCLPLMNDKERRHHYIRERYGWDKIADEFLKIISTTAKNR